MATLARATRHVKSNLSAFLPEHVIRDAAVAVNHSSRQRKLGPARTVLLLVLQMLAANASLAQARAMGGYTFSISALAQARARLPIALLQRVLAWLVAQVAGVAQGPRVVLIDAFNTYTPDTPALRRSYRRPRQQRRGVDYPQLRTVAVFDLASGVLWAQHAFRSDQHESPQLRHLIDAALSAGVLRRGDVVVFDRGFVAYANLCLLIEHGLQVVARLAKGLIARRSGLSRRTRLARLGKGDLRVRWNKPKTRPPGCPLNARQWNALPESLPLRQIRLTITPRNGCRSKRLTLITSLTDATTHPATLLAEWYRRRWEVEQDLRHMKQTLNFEFLRTKSPANIERELLLRAIAYNLVRLAMRHAAQARGLTDPGRISFADACRWLHLASATGVSPLALLINPQRTRSPRPRRVKYRGRNYRLLTTRPQPQYKVA